MESQANKLQVYWFNCRKSELCGFLTNILLYKSISKSSNFDSLVLPAIECSTKIRMHTVFTTFFNVMLIGIHVMNRSKLSYCKIMYLMIKLYIIGIISTCSLLFKDQKGTHCIYWTQVSQIRPFT